MLESKVRKCERSGALGRARWREHVAAQARSDLPVAAYCQEQGLATYSFYRWRRVFLQEAAAERGRTGMGAGLGEASSQPLFAEVHVAPAVPPSAHAGVELVLPGERRIHLTPSFDEDTLRRAIAVLESLSC